MTAHHHSKGTDGIKSVPTRVPTDRQREYAD